jgi:hypothetical protein
MVEKRREQEAEKRDEDYEKQEKWDRCCWWWWRRRRRRINDNDFGWDHGEEEGVRIRYRLKEGEGGKGKKENKKFKELKVVWAHLQEHCTQQLVLVCRMERVGQHQAPSEVLVQIRLSSAARNGRRVNYDWVGIGQKSGSVCW